MPNQIDVKGRYDTVARTERYQREKVGVAIDGAAHRVGCVGAMMPGKLSHLEREGELPLYGGLEIEVKGYGPG